MSRKFLFTLLGAVALVGLLLAVQYWPASSSGDRPQTLTIAAISATADGKTAYPGITAVVQEQGWLEKELAARGVKLEWFPVSTAVGGPLINESFASKRIAFAAYGDFPAIIANAGGIETRIVVPYGNGGTTAYLIVRKGLNARTIRDLKGLKIALHRGRPWELPFAKLAQANGLKQSDFKIYNLNPQASAAALASGEIDGFFTLSDGLLLQKQGLGRVIWSTHQAPPEWRIRAELFGRRDFVEQQPELTQLVATAFVKASHWASLPENRDKYIDYSAQIGVPRDLVVQDLNDGQPLKEQLSPILSQAARDHYRDVADYTFRQKLVPKKVDTDALFAPQFVDKALKDLKLEGYWTAQGAGSR